MKFELAEARSRADAAEHRTVRYDRGATWGLRVGLESELRACLSDLRELERVRDHLKSKVVAASKERRSMLDRIECLERRHRTSKTERRTARRERDVAKRHLAQAKDEIRMLRREVDDHRLHQQQRLHQHQRRLSSRSADADDDRTEREDNNDRGDSQRSLFSFGGSGGDSHQEGQLVHHPTNKRNLKLLCE